MGVKYEKNKKMVRILGAVIMTGAMAFTIAGCLNTESEETAPAQSTVIDETRYSSDNTAPVTDTVPADEVMFEEEINFSADSQLYTDNSFETAPDTGMPALEY